MLKIALAAAAIILQTTASHAGFFMYCEEPDPPYCADGYGAFDDEHEFESCLSEMEDYESDVEGYISCLTSNSNEAVDEYNSTVRDFNSRAGG
jgi:hypothetical protein